MPARGKKATATPALKPGEYARLIERLDLPNQRFCQALRIDERTGRRWKADEVAAPAAIAAVLRLADIAGLRGEALLRFLEKGKL